MTLVLKISADGKITSSKIVEGDYSKAIAAPGQYAILPVITVEKKKKDESEA